MKALPLLLVAGSLVSGICHAQQTDDPVEANSFAFSFEEAWNAYEENGAAMAMIPDPECEAQSPDGVCDDYLIGVSLTGNGEVTPIFNAYGHLEETKIWVLPESDAYHHFDLGTVVDLDGRNGVVGDMHVVRSMIAGWLSTPNGYTEYVTGYLWSVAMEFEAPQVNRVGSMIFTPTRTWSDPDLGYAYMASMADALWEERPQRSVHSLSQGIRNVDRKRNDKCAAEYRIDIKRCEEYLDIDLARLRANHRDCIDRIGFLDVLVGASVGGAGGATAGAAVGAGCGTVTLPLVGTVAGGVFGGIVCGVVGGIGGAFTGPALAEEVCDEIRTTAFNEAMAQSKRCLADAKAKYERCLAQNR